MKTYKVRVSAKAYFTVDANCEEEANEKACEVWFHMERVINNNTEVLYGVKFEIERFEHKSYYVYSDGAD